MKHILLFTGCFLLLISTVHKSFAQELTAREIIKKDDDKRRGLTSQGTMTLTKLTDDNLKNPPRCETTVTISEKDDAGKQILEATILIIGPKGKKELKYSLFYGETKERRSYEYVYIDPTYIEFNRKLLANVDEIVAAVLQLK